MDPTEQFREVLIPGPPRQLRRWNDVSIAIALDECRNLRGRTLAQPKHRQHNMPQSRNSILVIGTTGTNSQTERPPTLLWINNGHYVLVP